MNLNECHCFCDKDECARFHNPQRAPCNCIRNISKSTKFIERILDITETIVRVLSICGIHECKAKAAADVIVFTFLHYDIVPDPVSDVLRKVIRKEDLFHDLGRKCRMNRVEAHLSYSVIKRAFKAFYFKQTADMYNPDFIDEFQWMKAAQRSADIYAGSEGCSEYERKKLENRIKCAYCSYIQRIKDAKRKEKEKSCNCCFCSKCKAFGGTGYKVYANALPKEDEEAYQFKKRLMEEGRMAAIGPQDPCGRKLLDWQTQVKTTEPCSCGADPCFCLNKPVCPCVDDPCMCKNCTMQDGIAVVWKNAPGQPQA